MSKEVSPGCLVKRLQSGRPGGPQARAFRADRGGCAAYYHILSAFFTSEIKKRNGRPMGRMGRIGKAPNTQAHKSQRNSKHQTPKRTAHSLVTLYYAFLRLFTLIYASLWEQAKRTEKPDGPRLSAFAGIFTAGGREQSGISGLQIGPKNANSGKTIAMDCPSCALLVFSRT